MLLRFFSLISFGLHSLPLAIHPLTQLRVRRGFKAPRQPCATLSPFRGRGEGEGVFGARRLAAWLFVFALLCPSAATLAGDEAPPAFHVTKLPLPRFVSLGADEVYVRAGPGQQFPIRFVYRREGLPVEIILEYENWRKIRDHDGQTGWAHQSLLSGRRRGLVTAAKPWPILARRNPESRALAFAEKNVVVDLLACDPVWCKIAALGPEKTIKGWMERKFIWGVYENQNFD